MKRSGKFLLAVGALALLVPAAARADYSAGQGTWTRLTGYFAGSGGEFTWDIPGLSTSAYDAKTKDQGSAGTFQTFCVEKQENLSGQPFEVIVSTSGASGSRAVLGGVGPSGDDLDPATAYLYTKFATGQLSGYDYDSTAGRSASAGELQKAIWAIEGEMNAGSLSGQALTWYNDATNSGATSIGNVRILNIWVPGHVGDTSVDPDTGKLLYARQDQLYLIPTPAALLMGLPLLGLLGVMRLARRKDA